MRAAPIVDQLTASGLRNIHGALEFAGLTQAPRGTSFYVVPEAETASDNSLVGEVGAIDQLVEEAFLVVIVTDAVARQGGVINERLEDLKDQVRDALAGWRHPRASRPCQWLGGSMLTMDGSSLAWAVRFSTAWHYRRLK